MFKQALVVLVTLGLGACALPAQHTYVRDAVSSRLYLYQQPAEGTARLDVVRGNGLFGGGCATELKIDGQIVAQFQAGEQASFYLAPGTHQLEARHFGSCDNGTATLSAQLNAGSNPTLAIGSHGKSLAWAQAAKS
ncbi:hypothetical protein ACYJW8_12560 [Frateuria aurantia]